MHAEVESAGGDQEEGENPEEKTRDPVGFAPGVEDERERQSQSHHAVSGGHPELIFPTDLQPHHWGHRRPRPLEDFFESLRVESLTRVILTEILTWPI